MLAGQQSALRRVATLVARGASPSEVFSAVAAELARSLGAPNAALFRYEADGSGTLLAAHDNPGLSKMPVGEHFSLGGDNIAAMVLRTGRAARMDSHDRAAGCAAARIRALGLRGGVGAPIVGDGRVWGVAIVGSPRHEPFPLTPGTGRGLRRLGRNRNRERTGSRRPDRVAGAHRQRRRQRPPTPGTGSA
ncbi:GAF domain-containing protein [Mycobacterium sp.]|uniref:GAF domain-containing protein n=1 Tax=Mycobacterium sp. TaxID=1785 RepID=UPI0039C9F1B5